MQTIGIAAWAIPGFAARGRRRRAAPLLVACVASAERLDQLGPNGGVFLSGQLELRQALDLPGFRGLNASSLARSLWRDTESLLAALPEK